MTAQAWRPPGRKAYSRLAAGRRVPHEYELVSTDLHYNYPMRFELPAANPVVAWYYRYREGSPLRARDWEQFADPRRTTYHGYVQLQDAREDVVDGLLREAAETRSHNDAWLSFLDRWYAPLRFPVHGLQMLAAYVGQMAPASRITNCAAFQSADELRRVQRIAYRTVQLGCTGAAAHRAAWEDAEAFQPLRELLERALTAYDWGEAFTVTNLVIKPRMDRLVNEQIAALGIKNLLGTGPEAEIEDLTAQDVVIVPAFGTDLITLKKIQDRGCQIVDTTCGDVMSVWKRVRQNATEQVTSIIHGKAEHEETKATASRALGLGGGGAP